MHAEPTTTLRERIVQAALTLGRREGLLLAAEDALSSYEALVGVDDAAATAAHAQAVTLVERVEKEVAP